MAVASSPALASPEGSRCRRVLSLAGVEGAFPIEASVLDAAARLRADVGAIEP